MKKKKELLQSKYLHREVTVDFYLPDLNNDEAPALLLLNDGQNLEEILFEDLLAGLYAKGQLQPLLCVGIHAGPDRRNEYATAKIKDYEGRGGYLANAYQLFILEELLPYIANQFGIEKFSSKNFAGFSMGGLCALDLVWNYPQLFSVAGVFSGSLWWRTRALDDGYNEDTDRIMHRQVREGSYNDGLKFYFTTGSQDETADRNNNGIIDSIDDTLGLIAELEEKGY
ncbi:MAG: alpha/beta hydrolase, partial [Chitinophagaceae bacterium]